MSEYQRNDDVGDENASCGDDDQEGTCPSGDLLVDYEDYLIVSCRQACLE